MASGKKILYFSTLSILLLYFTFSGLIKAKSFLAPLSIAVILSLLVYPLSRMMERSFVNRMTASLINTILLFLISVGFFALLSMQVKNLANDWPKIEETMTPKIEKLEQFIQDRTPLDASDFKNSTENTSFPYLGIGANPRKKAAGILNSVMSFFGTYLLTFVYIFFTLNYRKHFKRFLLKLFPDERRQRIENIITNSADVTQKYLLGKLILIAFLVVFYSIGLGLSGVSNFILVSVLAAVFSLIPYVGNVIGFGMAMVFGYLTSGDLSILIGISLTFFIGQFIESYILNPYIVGEKVDLHPFVVIVSVIIGNLVWGIVGMILAIPILAIINVIFRNVESLEPFGYLLSKEKKADAK